VALTDSAGRPLTDASVELEAFHHARAALVLKASLGASADGTYRAILPMRRSGKWAIRLRVTRGDDLFTWKKDEFLSVR
jgi:hypothetical protein